MKVCLRNVTVVVLLCLCAQVGAPPTSDKQEEQGVRKIGTRSDSGSEGDIDQSRQKEQSNEAQNNSDKSKEQPPPSLEDQKQQQQQQQQTGAAAAAGDETDTSGAAGAGPPSSPPTPPAAPPPSSSTKLPASPSPPTPTPTPDASSNCTNTSECEEGVKPSLKQMLTSMVSENKGMLTRTLYVLIGVTLIVVVYYVMRAIRLRKKSKTKKYGVISSRDADLEMRPLEADDDDDDVTVFEVNGMTDFRSTSSR